LHEYGASVSFVSLPYYKACWITSEDKVKMEEFCRFKQSVLGNDKEGNLIYLAQSEWYLNTERTNNPAIKFHFTSEFKNDEEEY
jgi:peptide chain release factor 3